MQRELSLTRLPKEILVQIVCFLKVDELIWLGDVLVDQTIPGKSPAYIVSAIRKVFNTREELLINKVKTMYRGQQIVNLPFWGYQTDGGVLQNNIPFWIGKAFLRTRKPMVGLMKYSSSTISGCISQDYHQFSHIIMDLSNVLRDYIGSQHFFDTLDETSLRLVIMLTFHVNLKDASFGLRQEFAKSKMKVIQYATTLSSFLTQNQDYNIRNQQIIRLNQVANVHEIELSRQFHSDIEQLGGNPAQTLVIGVKNKITLVNLKGLRPSIFQTNLTREELLQWKMEQKFENVQSYKYILFNVNEQGILLWFDFGNHKTTRLSIPFSVRPWTSDVHVCILRGRNENSAQGLTMSYISLKGVVV